MSTDLDITTSLGVTDVPSIVHAPAEASEKPLAEILPQAGWQPVNVRELWNYRELLYFLTWRDVKVRYKQTMLGAAWAVLQPAMWMIVFTIFFSRMAKVQTGDVPYPIFAYLGFLPWTFFATAISNAGNSVVGSERLVTKVYFPRLSIPFASVAAAVVDFAIACTLLIALMCWYGVRPGATVVLAPLILAVIMVIALGIGTLLAALNVAYRDFRYVIPFLVQIWMLATPTVYMQPENTTGGKWHAILALNPMTGLIAAIRQAVLGLPIDWVSVGISIIAGIAFFLFGCFYFRRMERSFADII
jgi:lipopolysaccharide transport system permease protein